MAYALTKARKAVLAALQSGGPASALDLGKRLASTCDQATVYRALHFLEDAGWADSFVLRCDIRGTERYYVARSQEHRHWLHCERCHEFVDLGACRVEPLFKEIEASLGVEIRSHTLYAAGLCRACGQELSLKTGLKPGLKPD
ncbi:MAG TPA: transcriptional repressor [Rectinemataceae bacterium]